MSVELRITEFYDAERYNALTPDEARHLALAKLAELGRLEIDMLPNTDYHREEIAAVQRLSDEVCALIRQMAVA